MTEFQAFKEILITVAVSLPRLAAVFAILPFLNRQILSGLVRNSFLFSLMLILYPLVAPTLPPRLDLVVVMLVIIKEVGVGIVIGFVVSMFFWTAESAGFLIDNQRGAGMAGVMDSMSGSQTSPLGSILLQVVAVLFFTSGGFLMLLSGLFESYRLWPVFAFFPSLDPDFPLFFLSQVDLLMQLTLLFAAPVVIAVFLAEFGLGLVNRFAPQLNVFFLAMPIKSGIASLLLIPYLYRLLPLIKDEALAFQDILPLLGELFHG